MKKSIILLFICFNTSCMFGQSKLIRSNWNLVFEENFDTYSKVDDMANKWRFDYPWGPTLVGNVDENQYYTKDNIILNQDGTITFRAKKLITPIVYEWDDANGHHSKNLKYTSGMIFSQQDFDNPCWAGNMGYTHGYFEMRCKLPKGLKTWAAWWLYSGSTEIDIFEAYDDKRGFTSTNHDWHDPHTACNNHFKKSYGEDLTTEFHNYGCVWTESKIIMFFDDVEIWSSDRIATTACPATLIANLAMIKGAIIDSTDFIVDYIKVFKMADPQLPFKTENAWTNNIIDNQKYANRKASSKPGSIVQIDENKIVFSKEGNTLGQFIKSSDNWTYSELPFSYTTEQKINGNLVPGNNGNLVYYRGMDGKIHGFKYLNGIISNFIVDDGNNASYSKINATSGSLVVSPNNAIYYRGTDNKLHKYIFENNSWKHILISNTTSSTDLIAGNLVINENNDIYYKGKDEFLHKYSSANGNYIHQKFNTLPKIEIGNFTLTGKSSTSLSQPFILSFIEKDTKIINWCYEEINGLSLPLKILPTNEHIPPKSNLSISSLQQIWYKGIDGKVNFLKNENGNWMHYWPNSWDNKNPIININTDNLISFNDNLLCYRNSEGYIKKIELKPFQSTNPPCDINDYFPDPIFRTSGTNSNFNKEIVFKVFPNPCSDKLFLEIPTLNTSMAELKIINTTGQIAMKKTITGGHQSIDVSQLADGIYFLLVDFNGEHLNAKFVVRK